MTEYEESAACTRGCWWLAAGVGLVVAAILWIGAGWSIIQALFAGVVIGVICGAAFSYIFCSKSRPPAVTTAPAPKPASTSVPERTSAETASAAPSAASAPAVDAASAPSPLKPSKDLPGQRELSERKGSWKYEGNASAKPAAKVQSDKPKRAAVAADGKPEMLTAARDGKADDLKLISGVGPKLEGVLNSMGVYHFDQIAGWRKKEIQWVDENLEGFKGRVERDDWVKQAKILAKGGETEFSARKKK